jgi:hypothetical protein
MNYSGAELPPTKKRRFFSEPSPASDQSLQFEASLPDHSKVPDSSCSKSTPISEDVQGREAAPSDTSPQDAIKSDIGQGIPQDFDIGLFKSVVGVEMAPETLKMIREAAGENMERGMNLDEI